jgi:hypothetical protein
MQSDCDDIRITDQNGQVLPHWIDNRNYSCNTANTQVWVKLPVLPASGTTVYVYYGQPTATSVNNGSQVFDFFDDFDDNLSNGWTPTTLDRQGTWTVTSGYYRQIDTPANWALSVNSNSITNGILEATVRQEGSNSGAVAIDGRYLNTSNYYHMQIYSNNINLYRRLSSTWNSLTAAAFPWAADTWYTLGLKFNGTSLTACANNTCTSTITDGNFSTGQFLISSYGGIHNFDNIRIRKIAPSTPVSTPATEETGGRPIAWWKFDEGVGTSAFDSSGKNNHGIFGSGTSAPTWTTEDQCISGKCLRLGDNNYLTSPNLPITQLSTCLWLKTNNSNSVTNDQIIGKYDMGQTQRVFSLTQNATTNYIGFTTSSDGSYQSGNDVTSTIAINDGKWHYLCGVYDATYNRLYIDGQLHNSTDRSNDGLYNTDEKIAIGSFISADTTVANSFFKGSIDDVRIYPYARSAAQIKQDYTSGLAGQSSSNSSTNIGNQSTKGLSDGLVAYWKFDEGVGTTSTDSSGNSNLATLSGTTLPSWSTGKHGSGIGFTGIGYIASGTTPSLAPQSSNFTVSSWVKYNGGGCGSGGCGIIGSNVGYIPAYKTGYSIIATSTNFRLMFGDSTNYFDTSFGTVATNQWQHLLIVFNRTNFEIQAYIDGQLVRTQSYSGVTGPIIMETNLHIGSRDYNGGSPFNGSLDEVRIYNRALSPDEVKQLYNYSPGPIGYWKFEESSGSTAYDSSGYGRNATLQNGAIFSNGKYGKALGLNLNGPANQWASLSSISHNYGFTKSAWVYPISTSQCGETRCSVIGPYFEILSNLQYYDNNLSPVGWKTGGSIPLNQWSYITVSNDNSFLKLFVNGIQVQSVGITNTGAHSSNAIGAYSSNIRNFHGLIDEVKIYNYARTQSQILEDMNIGTSTVSSQVGQTSQTIGGTTTSLEHCIPGDTSHCASPIAEWKFEEGVGTTAYSQGTSSSNAIMATGTSSPSWSNGRIGKSLTFDGNDYLYYPKNLLVGTTGLTISAWFKTNATNAPIVTEYQNSSGYQYRLVVRSGLLSGCVGTVNADGSCGPNSVQVGTSTPVNDNQWHFATLSYDNNQVKLYLNGRFITQYSKSGSIQSNLVLYPYIGTQGYNTGSGLVTQSLGFFNGSIDHVRIYNYARTPAQIAYDYNKGEPIGWWKLDECQGSVANDSSGMNNTGSISIGASGTQTSAGTCTTSNTAWGVGATGKINSSLNFDGVDDKVTVPLFNTQNTNVSMSAWVYWKGSSEVKSIIYNGNGGANGYGLLISNGNCGPGNEIGILLGGTSCDVTNSTTIMPSNQWTHLALTRDTSTWKLYVNGNTVASGSGNANIPSDGFGIGTGGNGVGSFNGQLDDVRVYNYSLTPQQVKTIYNGGALNFR